MAKPAQAGRAEETGLDDSSLEDFVGYNLKRAYIIVQNDFRETLGKDGLSGRSFSALSLVVEFPGITQSALARRLGIERSGLVAIVDALEQRGYIRRAAVPGDRRAQALVPKEAGKRAFLAAVGAVRQHERRLLSDLTEDERETLLTLLRKIREREDD